MSAKRFQKNIVDGVEYLTFPILEDTGVVNHLFTTRKGGVSKGIYSSMNVSFTRGDDPEAVMENYRRISKIMNCDINDFVCAHQTHTSNIRFVTEKDKGKGVTRDLDYENIDGLITNIPGIVLVTHYADCVPIFFVDSKEKVIGLAHSGYRGTLKRIGACMVKAMCQNYGCNKENIKAVIGPSICCDCYEVGEEVASEFFNQFANEKDSIVKPGNREGKFYLDLWEANQKILLHAGIKEENLCVAKLCTCCNYGELFSHRASNGKRGNLGAFLSLKEK